MTPSKKQEAQQTQTIMEIRCALADTKNGHAFDDYTMRLVINLVDSKTRKIAELEKEVGRLKKLDSAVENARTDKSLTEYYRRSL